jgi:pilus assembly protein Flp/PilA
MEFIAQASGGVIMRGLARLIGEFLKSEEGPTAVEYAVMLAMIILVCFASIILVGNAASTNFGNTSLSMSLGGSS